MPRNNPADADAQNDLSADPLMEQDTAIRNELIQLGLDPKMFTDEPDCPVVDQSVLEQLASRQLDEASSKLVFQFIVRYKPWRDAFCQILVRQFNEDNDSKTGN